MKTLIGIDPGFEGALAFYEPPDGGLLDDWVMRTTVMPTIATKGRPRPGKKKARVRHEYDEGELHKLLSPYSPYHGGQAHVFLEFQQPMLRWDPNRWDEKAKKMGMNVPPAMQSTWNLAAGFYTLRGILAGLQIPYTLVRPKAWQAVILAGREKVDTKAHAIIVAKQAFPMLDLRKSDRCRNPHEGIVDAVLIAAYGYQQLYGGVGCVQINSGNLSH
jgi:hypothetical protein